MKKILNQVLYNFRKDLSSYISFGIIIMITALILNCAAVLLLQVDEAYDAKFRALNTAGVNVILPELQDSDKLQQTLDKIEGVAQAERHRGLLVEATVKEFLNTDFSMNTVFYNLDSERTNNSFTVVEETDQTVSNPIYIPLYIAKCGFALNDEIVYVMNGKSHVFTVAGIIEEMQYGNYGSGLICAYLPEEGFGALADTLSDKAVVEYALTLQSGNQRRHDAFLPRWRKRKKHPQHGLRSADPDPGGICGDYPCGQRVPEQFQS